MKTARAKREKEKGESGLVEIRIKVDKVLDQAIKDEAQDRGRQTKSSCVRWLLASVLKTRTDLIRQRSLHA